MITSEEVINYIPQRAPMIMVSELLRADEKSADTLLTVLPENIFVNNGFFTEPGIVEHIAQSTALHAGYGFIKAGKSVPVGYIAAVKNLTIHYLPKVNEVLNTHVKIVNYVMNVILVSAEVKSEQNVVASCEMRVFVKE